VVVGKRDEHNDDGHFLVGVGSGRTLLTQWTFAARNKNKFIFTFTFSNHHRVALHNSADPAPQTIFAFTPRVLGTVLNVRDGEGSVPTGAGALRKFASVTMKLKFVVRRRCSRS
jgi:hypothetical protein